MTEVERRGHSMKVRISRAIWGLSLVVLIPALARADTVYAYKGNPYTICFGAYASSGTTCAGSYAMSLTFDVMAGTSLDDLSPDTDITADVSKFSFNDAAGLSITQANATADDFQIGTNASGDITSWLIDASYVPFPTGTALSAETEYEPPLVIDQSYVQQYVDGVPGANGVGSSLTLGTWKMTVIPTVVPEPSAPLQFAAGLLSLLPLAARRKRRVATTIR